MKPFAQKYFLTIFLFLMVLPLQAESLDVTLQTLISDNARGYLGPAPTAFGTNINSGTFHTAATHKFLGFDFTLNSSVAEIPDADLTFDFILPQEQLPFNIPFMGGSVDVSMSLDQLYEDDRAVPTIFGSKDEGSIEVDELKAQNIIAQQISDETGVSVEDVIATAGPEIIAQIQAANLGPITTPAGFDLGLVPMIIPQFAVGLPFDLEVMVRGYPKTNFEDIGEVSFLGYGAKIGLNQFNPLPIPFLPRVSVGYYQTNLTIGSILDASNTIINLQVSKSIPFLTVYGGYGIESSSMDVNYDYTDGTRTTQNINFSLDGKNETRITAGLRLKLAMFSLNADYSQGEYTSYNLGLGITLR
ncbi:MAG: hypothetical protein GXO91_09925 [FCB group bacterium]|nr:hypothetical protein [FCB group bacterium]